ncbi:MAG: TetR/AcrR family transcriptional regulator [Mycobacterium sp.]
MAHVPSADRRQQFIEAASRVIEQHGVARATTRRIADEAGAPLAALHYCFSTKEELFEAVSATTGWSDLAPAMENVHPGMGIAAAVDVLLQSTAKYISANLAAELGEIEISVWALRSGRPEMPRRVYDAWLGLAESALEDARAEDEQDQDIAAITRLVTNLLDGCVRADLMTNRQSLEESAEVASRTIAAAIAAGVFRRS